MPLPILSPTPRLKTALYNTLETESPWQATSDWGCWYWPDTFSGASFAVRWQPPSSQRALNAQGLRSLSWTLRSPAFSAWLDQNGIAHGYWIITSAGADVHDPFASFKALNQLIETVLDLKHTHSMSFTGVVDTPLGTYGGASLFLATVCDSLWCDTPTDLHLLGNH